MRDRASRAATYGMLPREQVVEHRADRVDVRARRRASRSRRAPARAACRRACRPRRRPSSASGESGAASRSLARSVCDRRSSGARTRGAMRRSCASLRAEHAREAPVHHVHLAEAARPSRWRASGRGGSRPSRARRPSPRTPSGARRARASRSSPPCSSKTSSKIVRQVAALDELHREVDAAARRRGRARARARCRGGRAGR